MIERTHEQRGSCVVHDQRHAEGPADRRDFGDRECDQFRVRQRFGVIGSGAIVGGASERLGIIRIDEPRFDPLVLQCVGEQVPGATIEVGRADDIVARARQILHRERRRRLAGPQGEGRHAALDRREPLLQNVVGRVHDPGVNVPEFLQGEQVRRVLGAVELIGRGLVDRHGDRIGGAVATPAGMQRQRFRVFAAHGACLPGSDLRLL